MASETQDALDYSLSPLLGRIARGARASALICGGSAPGRQRVAEALHRVGRTADGPLIVLVENAGLREMLVRLLREGVSGWAPATLYFDRAECMDEEMRRLILAVIDHAQEHWLSVPGRRDGLRVIGGARYAERVDLALARVLGALRVDAFDAVAPGARMETPRRMGRVRRLPMLLATPSTKQA